ncbi:MAG: holin [Oscillospiraceae bacterium]|nr:holin [Oscillospiraceae bacterium]
MNEKLIQRLRSPVVWMSVSSQILSVLVLLGVIGENWSGAVTGIISALLEALTVFGVLNNPTDADRF